MKSRQPLKLKGADPSEFNSVSYTHLLPVDSIDNQAVLSQVAEKADFKTSTNVVTIGEQKFAVKDTAVVESTLMDLMKYYTGTENLAKIMDTANPIQALSETGSQYIGAKVVEPVKVESSYAAPDEVLTTDQMRRMMLYLSLIHI